MNALLDTHVLLWWMADDPRLTAAAREVISDPATKLLWSAASTWELAIKSAAGKIQLPEPVDAYVQRRLAQQAIGSLSVTHAHAAHVEGLPMHHRDPFDRLLIAQASLEDLTLVTGDLWMRSYEIQVIW